METNRDNRYSAAERRPFFQQRGELTLDLLLVLAGAAVICFFMLGSLSHGYLQLQLIPPLAFVGDELASQLLAAGLMAFTFVALPRVLSGWTKQTGAYRTFLTFCCALVLALDLALVGSAIIERTVTAPFIENAKRRIDSLLVMAAMINREITDVHAQHASVLQDAIQKARHGDDGTDIAKCGPICIKRTESRDRFQRMFYVLAQPAAVPSPDTAENVNEGFAKLLTAKHIIEGRYYVFTKFQSVVGLEYPVNHEYETFQKEVIAVQSEVFDGGRAISKPALNLRLAAAVFWRCLTLSASAIEYVIFTVTLALVVLLSAFAVLRRLVTDSTHVLHDQADHLRAEARTLSVLKEAMEERGKAKLAIDAAVRFWKNITEPTQK